MSDNKNLLEFPSASTLTSVDYFHINQGGIDKKVPASVVQAATITGAIPTLVPQDESGTTRLITLGDKDGLIQCVNPLGCVVTLPSDAQAPFALGEMVTVKNDSEGIVTFTSTSGVTIRESSIGLAMDIKGQAATFVKVGNNTWNMISGGGGNSGASQRFKAMRTVDFPSVNNSFVKDNVLTISNLLPGSTYKVDAFLSFYSADFEPVGAGYAVTFEGASPTSTTLAQGEFQTHICSPALTSPSVTNKVPGMVFGSSMTTNLGGHMIARVSGEIILPLNSTGISVYWASSVALTDVTLMAGSTLIVERV